MSENVCVPSAQKQQASSNSSTDQQSNSNKEAEYQKKIVELRSRYLDTMTSYYKSFKQPDEGERKRLAKTKAFLSTLDGTRKVSLDVLLKCETSLNMIFCRLCDKNFKETVFLPCGHREVCEECSVNIKKCFICYTMVEERNYSPIMDCHFQIPSTQRKRKYKEIEDELAELKEAQCCPICMESRRDTVLIDHSFSCGHTVCAGCAPCIKKCPICRKQVNVSMKFYPC